MKQASLHIADDIVYEVLAGETVILNLATGEYYSLNVTGTRTLQLIEELGDLDAVWATMASEFHVEPEDLGHDLALLVQELLARQLIVVGPSTRMAGDFGMTPFPLKASP